MRIRLFNAISDRLGRVRIVDGLPVYLRPQEGENEADLPQQAIKTLDLWNEQIDQLTQQQPFNTPAVFVEFLPIIWTKLGKGAQRAEAQIRLHIVSATLATVSSQYREQALYRLRLTKAIQAAFVGFNGPTDAEGLMFGTFVHTQSETDHNHTDICEDIETWQTLCIDASAAISDGTTETPHDVTLNMGDIFTAVFNDSYV